MDNVKRLLSIKELVEAVGMTEWFWRTKIWDGSLPYLKQAKRYLVDINDVEQFIKMNKMREKQ